MQKQYSSYQDVPDSVWEEFRTKLEMFIEDNVPVDGEGDLCFEVSVIDRRNYNSLNYIPIKYSYWQNEKKITAKEKFQEAYDNLKHARFNQLLANDSVNSQIGELDQAVERMKKEGLL